MTFPVERYGLSDLISNSWFTWTAVPLSPLRKSAITPMFENLSALCRIAPTRNRFRRQGIVLGATSSCECHTAETRCTRSAGAFC
jgi:hypothetical protein